MSYLIFNGVSTAERGLIVSKMPNLHRAAKKTTSVSPYGFDGAMISTEGNAYETYTETAVINCFGHDPGDVFSVFHGEGWLTTSDEPEKKRWAYCYSDTTAARDRAGNGRIYDSVTVTFVLDPFAYESVPETVTITGSGMITGRGNEDARPLIKVTGAGSPTIMVGACSMLLSGMKAAQPLYIDALAKYAYVMKDGEMTSAYAAGVTVNMMVSAGDRWPILKHDGQTAVSVTGGAILEMTPNWRWF